MLSTPNREKQMVIKPETILEQAATGIIAIDIHGHIQFANTRSQQILDRKISLDTPLETIEPKIADEVFSCIEKKCWQTPLQGKQT